VYFDLKDENASVKFFGTIYQLPGPLEDGMLLKVRGTPKLHQLYGFSVTIMNIQPAGEGTIRRAAELLQIKLHAEGLFDVARKRSLPYPPKHIGLIASKQSAAYADFMKILDARWRGVLVEHIDVQVQGEPAPGQIVHAIEEFNRLSCPPDVLVLIRGGGSPEDLSAFSTEQVTRAVASSRIVTLVAIGHEVDTCMAELAADQRASTPSNAAELLVPDRHQVLGELVSKAERLQQLRSRLMATANQLLSDQRVLLNELIVARLEQNELQLIQKRNLLVALSPEAILRRGYALIRYEDKVIRKSEQLTRGQTVNLQLSDGRTNAIIQ
jgi:exodeoxyribonuclease VII large subunit